MYKLLVENSRDYGNKKVTEAILEFVEEEEGGKIREIKMIFDKETDKEVERLKNLAVVVYKKIVSLDFPDTEKYEKSMEGVKEFEEDLLAGRV